MPHSGYIKHFELAATGFKFPLDFFGYIDGEIIREVRFRYLRSF